MLKQNANNIYVWHTGVFLTKRQMKGLILHNAACFRISRSLACVEKGLPQPYTIPAEMRASKRSLVSHLSQ